METFYNITRLLTVADIAQPIFATFQIDDAPGDVWGFGLRSERPGFSWWRWLGWWIVGVNPRHDAHEKTS